MAATGHKVILYGDPGCLEEPIATLTRDDTCYSAQSDVSTMFDLDNHRRLTNMLEIRRSIRNRAGRQGVISGESH
jgi:hypothetical protein